MGKVRKEVSMEEFTGSGTRKCKGPVRRRRMVLPSSKIRLV